MQMFAGAEGATDAPNNPQQEDGSKCYVAMIVSSVPFTRYELVVAGGTADG